MHANDVVNHPGAGVEGRIGNRRVRIGNAAFVAELAGEAPPDLLDGADNASIVALGEAGSVEKSGWLAVFSLGDRAAMKRARSFVRCLTGARSSLFCPAIVRTSCGVLQESWPSLT